jgi:hypothetical protein
LQRLNQIERITSMGPEPSGLTGAASGVVGKLDENIMGGLAAEVLVAGVRKGRGDIRDAILNKMQSSYASWPVEVAIADLMTYHGRCNVMSGLTTAQRLLSETTVQPKTPTPATQRN